MRNNKGQFTEKGNIGRPFGTKSKRTTELREKFFELVQANESTLHDDLQSLKPKERLDIILNLASYLIPKLKATEMTVEDKTDSQFQPIKIERIVIDNTKDNGTE